MIRHAISILFVLVSTSAVSRAESLTVDVGDAKIASASTTAIGTKTEVSGVVTNGSVKFDRLLSGERYDVRLAQPDGKQLRLIDASWYADAAPPAPEPGPLSDDDRKEIGTILTDIKAFTNKNEIVQLVGNADRAVAIVELTRDTDFHARQGEEIIWRIEVWYFENQAGGWAKVQQQNRVIERVRFKSREEYEKTRGAMKWIAIEKGLHIRRGEDARVKLP